MPTDRKQPIRREQILDAAAELFARHGFHGVGIDDIGAAIGISGPALYRHFRGKDAILCEMLTSISEFLFNEGKRRRAATDPKEALAALIRFQVEFALDNRALIIVQQHDLTNLAESDQQRIRELQRHYVTVWTEAIQESTHGLSEQAAKAAAHAVLGLINSTPHSSFLDRERMVELLCHMTFGALASAGTQEI